MKITISQQFQEYMQGIGINLNDTLQRAGIHQIIWQESIELNDSEYWRLMNELDNEMSDQNIIRLSEIDKMNTFMPSFFVALTADNGIKAIKRLAEYKALVGPVQLVISNNGETTSVHISGTNLTIDPPRFTVMVEQLLIVSLLRTGTSQSIEPVIVGSQYQYGTTISKTLKKEPIKLDRNEIVFDNNDLNQSFISSNNVMWKLIRPELNRKKMEIENYHSMDENIQALLIKKIPSGDFSIDEIASVLNISKRTLQRNLKNLNTSFNLQIQYARKTLVEPFMKDQTLSLIDISYLLGYSDPESFSRAFKKWYGQSPSNYRKELQIIDDK